MARRRCDPDGREIRKGMCVKFLGTFYFLGEEREREGGVWDLKKRKERKRKWCAHYMRKRGGERKVQLWGYCYGRFII